MEDTEKYVVGAGKYEYVALLAWQFPECEELVDEEGNLTGEYDETPHYTCFLNDRDAATVLQDTGLAGRESDFYRQESIISVIEAYQLDKEKFWYVVVYVAWLTKQWSVFKSIQPLPSAIEQLTTMRDEIKNRNEFRIVIDDPTEGHSFVMAGGFLINKILVPALEKLIDEERALNRENRFEVPVWRMEESYKKSELTWYSANLFKLLFDCMKLPILRSRSVKTETRIIAGEAVRVKGHSADVSYDKNQLIAELIHFLDFTENPNLDGNSIRAILRSEREFTLGIY